MIKSAHALTRIDAYFRHARVRGLDTLQQTRKKKSHTIGTPIYAKTTHLNDLFEMTYLVT